MSEFVKVCVNGINHWVYLDTLPEVLPEGKVYLFVCEDVERKEGITMVRYDGTLTYSTLSDVIMGYVEYNILALHGTAVD